MKLRDYQVEAVEAAIDWLRKSREYSVIEAATGAGKSLIIAAIAKWCNEKTGKKVLCLPPSQELVIQNHQKYTMAGNNASIYCASVSKSLRYPVVFGSPVSVLNAIDNFCENFSLVIIDECHGITPTIKKIISALKEKNKNLRVLGLSASPYRLGDGFIYEHDEKGLPVSQAQTRNPFFKKLLCKITARELIDKGYLTAPVSDSELSGHYECAGLELNKLGKFDAQEVDRAFLGHGRLTAAIVAEIIDKSIGRKGVMLFASTVAHAKEVLASLPREISAIVTGDTDKKERAQIIADFKAQKIKYLVNVAVLTTGFDAPHVDVVAILRATESVGLLQQIIGRGLRLCEGKRDCLVLDYAENIERHCPDGDIFNPQIKAAYQGSGEEIPAKCPLCKTINSFAMRKNDSGLGIDEEGYFLDLAGNRIIDQDTEQELPAHYGRRCFGFVLVAGNAERCNHRWSCKKCPDCNHENDIAARYCESCKAEMIDPNKKLVIEFAKMKADPYQTSTDKVLAWNVSPHINKKGAAMVKVELTTDCASFVVFAAPEGYFHASKWKMLCEAVGSKASAPDEFVSEFLAFELDKPKTVTARKNKASGFYDVFAFNREESKLEI